MSVRRRKVRPASLGQRLWAAFLDALLLISWVVFVALVAPWPEALPGPLRAAVWFGPFLLLEPISISLFGRTVGQRSRQLRVISTSGKKASFPRLLARHLSKGLFLGVSPLYTLFSPHGQALHDHLFKTGVVTRVSVAPLRSGQLRAPLRAFLVSMCASVLVGVLAAFAVLLGIVVGLEFAGVDLPEGPTAEAVLSLPASVAFLWAQFRILHRGARGGLLGTGGLADIPSPPESAA